MAIQVTCHSCGRKFRLKDEVAGRKFKCKECGEVLVAEAAGGQRQKRPADDESSAGGSSAGGSGKRRRKKEPPADPWAAGDDLYGSALDRFGGNFGEDYEDEDHPDGAPTRSRAVRRRSRPVQPTLLQLLFSFEGRISRSTLGNVNGAIFIYFLVIGGIGNAVEGTAMEIVVAVITLVTFFPLCWIALATQVKRWHDRDKSGFMVLINLICCIGGIWAFIECVWLPGTPGDNQYGPEPG